MPLMVSADSYSSLWKKVDNAEQKDLPKDKIAVLQSICNKALSERQWGQFLKAELNIVATQAEISPDSIQPMVSELEQKAVTAQRVDPVLAAVYNSCLGTIYEEGGWLDNVVSQDSLKLQSREHYEKALSNLKILANAKARDYEPLLVNGGTSLVYDNDLLHVVAFQAKEYMLAHDWYKEHGNRPAACLSAYYHIQKERFEDVKEVKKSKYTARLDSLINEYIDIPEAGEVAIERFNFMDQATDASAKEKVDYIDYALRTWPTWPRMAVLRNARAHITLPSFHVLLKETTVIPNTEIPVYITSLVNLQNLHVTVTKLKMNGADSFNPSNEEDLKLIRSLKEDTPIFEDNIEYYGLPDYKEVRDTMKISPLPLGVYLVEFTTNNNQVAAERALLRVTNLRLLDMDMPNKQVRLIAVDATTGKPVDGAKITLKFREWKKGKYQESEEILKTEKNGEVTFSSTLRPYQYRVTTATDNAMKWTSISASWTEPSKVREIKNVEGIIYTDRSIYRPGQKVHASIVVFDNERYNNCSNAKKDVEIEFEVMDMERNTVYDNSVKTDEWGVATIDFDLPKVVSRTGNFLVQADFAGSSAMKLIRVEEYKRPTFIVEIENYKDKYKDGDTITVVGHAETYAGVPVQGAKVVYHSSSSTASWWRMYAKNVESGSNSEGEATTMADGSFKMRIPIVKPAGDSPHYHGFYSVNISAEVTSLSGETHSGSLSLPLSDKETALVIGDLPSKVCKEQSYEVTFRYLNNAGQPVESSLLYDIDGKTPTNVDANKKTTIDFTSLAEGEHILNLYCDGDSVSQKFVYFSLDDKAPVIDTDDWFYDTAGDYKGTYYFKDDEPVRMQIGTSRQDQTIFYAIVTGTDIIEEGSFVLSNANMNRAISYKEEWGDGIAMRYSWVRDGKMYTHAQRLHKPERDRSLNLEWNTFRDKLQPGQKEEWIVSVKNPDGTPAKAHMLATLYDKSLDVLAGNVWNMKLPSYSFTPNIGASQRNIDSSISLYGEQSIRDLNEPSLDLYYFNIPYFNYRLSLRDFDRRVRIRGLATKSAPRLMADGSLNLGTTVLMEDDSVLNDVVVVGYGTQKKSADVFYAVEEAAPNAAVTEDVDIDIPVRTNLDETATYQSELITDKDGNVAIKFTLPESLTSWRFIGLAHDKDMNNGTITGEAIAQKPLMVQPNMPRFLREGDKGELVSTITNTTEKTITGTATMVIKNAETENTVYSKKVAFNVVGNQTADVKFTLPENLSADMYVVKIIAQSKSFSDGEQQYLPVLSEKELITTSRAITQVHPGQKVIDLNKLFGNGTSNESVTVEYTNNPAWLMIDALPAVIKDCKDQQNSVSLSTALYAAIIARAIKNEVEDVELNVDSLDATIKQVRTALTTLQNEDGSFSWWPSMPGSCYMTESVVRNLVRLDHLLGTQSENNEIITKAMNFLAKEISKEVVELKKSDKNNKKNRMPSELAMDYLYLQALREGTLTKNQRTDVEYLMSLLEKKSKELTIYGKSNLAVAFALMKDGGDKKKAQELMESAIQYSVSTEEMGRYFDTPKAHYSWCSYKIPTETAAIEALLAVRPEDTITVSEMRQWLLNEKRTQQWDTPISTTSAIYAFLNGNIDTLDDVAEPAKVKMDNKIFFTSGEKKGYFKTTEKGRYNTLTIDKTSTGMSWGAVYTQAMQKVSDVEVSDENQLKITREILTAEGKDAKEFKIGDKVKVRLTITAGRDYDFVEVVDNRAACLEPVNQISGYRWGYYTCPGDQKTSYYFNMLPKGKHVIETEYFVDRTGTYQSGLAIARCAYAPEFSARDKAITLITK